jgi:hypothetical protein
VLVHASKPRALYKMKRVAEPSKVRLNGDFVNEGFDATVDQGRIALQAEGAEVEFRKVRIGPLSALRP